MLFKFSHFCWIRATTVIICPLEHPVNQEYYFYLRTVCQRAGISFISVVIRYIYILCKYEQTTFDLFTVGFEPSSDIRALEIPNGNIRMLLEMHKYLPRILKPEISLRIYTRDSINLETQIFILIDSTNKWHIHIKRVSYFCYYWYKVLFLGENRTWEYCSIWNIFVN